MVDTRSHRVGCPPPPDKRPRPTGDAGATDATHTTRPRRDRPERRHGDSMRRPRPPDRDDKRLPHLRHAHPRDPSNGPCLHEETHPDPTPRPWHGMENRGGLYADATFKWATGWTAYTERRDDIWDNPTTLQPENTRRALAHHPDADVGAALADRKSTCAAHSFGRKQQPKATDRPDVMSSTASRIARRGAPRNPT